MSEPIFSTHNPADQSELSPVKATEEAAVAKVVAKARKAAKAAPSAAKKAPVRKARARN